MTVKPNEMWSRFFGILCSVCTPCTTGSSKCHNVFFSSWPLLRLKKYVRQKFLLPPFFRGKRIFFFIFSNLPKKSQNLFSMKLAVKNFEIFSENCKKKQFLPQRQKGDTGEIQCFLLTRDRGKHQGGRLANFLH